MKKIVSFLLIAFCFFNCTEKKKTIEFVTLNETEFNINRFNMFPGDVMPDSIKHAQKEAHDSCMGFSFDANVMLVKTQDTFFIGSIINRQSLKIINTISDLGQTQAQLMPQFNVLTTPCYEKRAWHFPVSLMLGGKLLKLPGADESITTEINDAILTSDKAEVQTGSWVYLDLKNAIKNILDTTETPAGLLYKNNVLDTANMVLTALESITDISFIINTKKDISLPLQTLLKTKPAALLPDSKFSIHLFYISSNKFQVSVNGFFPVVGQFMKAGLK